MNSDQEILAWKSWHEACAFGLIEGEERRGLQKVVGDRFRSRVKRLNAHGAGLPRPEDAACSHLFEAWCAVHQRRDGKRYKDWLMNRGRRDLDTIQSGVMLLVRNVVREWVRDSHAQVAEMSLDQPISESSGLRLRELLPSMDDPRSEEHTGWVSIQSAKLLREAEDVEIAVLRIRAEGKVFSHPEVNRETGFGKTKLHAMHRSLLERIAEELQQDFPGLDAVTSSGMVLDVLDQAGQILLSKISAEN